MKMIKPFVGLGLCMIGFVAWKLFNNLKQKNNSLSKTETLQLL